MTTIRVIAFASLVLVAPALMAQSNHPSGFAVSTEKVEGWNGCSIVQSRDAITSGWYKESNPGSTTTKYWAKSKDDCRGLAEWIQAKRPSKISKKLTFNQAGGTGMGNRSAATYTQYQFDDGYLPFSDSSESIYSRDVRSALAQTEGKAHKKAEHYTSTKAAGSQNVAFAQPK